MSDWEDGVRERPPSGKVHKCTVCGKEDIWGPTWSWYGSYADLEEGRVALRFCSDACAGDKAKVELNIERLKKLDEAAQDLADAEKALDVAQAKVNRLKRRLAKLNEPLERGAGQMAGIE